MSDPRGAIADELIEETLDPGAREEREETERDRVRAEGRRKAFLIGIMQNPDGQLFLKDLLAEFHAFETRFATIPGERTWFFAGEQKCGWYLWNKLDDADPVLASRLRRGI